MFRIKMTSLAVVAMSIICVVAATPASATSFEFHHKLCEKAVKAHQISGRRRKPANL
jgi:hypothetical protein